MDTSPSVQPLGALKAASSSLPDLHAASMADETGKYDIRTPTKTAAADPTMAASMSADTLLLPTVRHGTAPEDIRKADDASAGLQQKDETDRLLPQSSDIALHATDEHPAQMITAALARQVSIDDAKQRAQAGSKDGVVAAPVLMAGKKGLNDDDSDDEEVDNNVDGNDVTARTADSTSCPRCCCTRQQDIRVASILLGVLLGVTAGYVALEHEDLEFLLIPAWRWICLSSVTLMSQALSRILYWVVKAILFHMNQFVEYYTLAPELRGAGLIWFRIVIQCSAAAILLRDYPEDNDTWQLVYGWIVRVMIWMIMLQTCHVVERVVSRCASALLWQSCTVVDESLFAIDISHCKLGRRYSRAVSGQHLLRADAKGMSPIY